MPIHRVYPYSFTTIFQYRCLIPDLSGRGLAVPGSELRRGAGWGSTLLRPLRGRGCALGVPGSELGFVQKGFFGVGVRWRSSWCRVLRGHALSGRAARASLARRKAPLL